MTTDCASDHLSFVGGVIEWRGPAPFHFVRLSPDAAQAVRAFAGHASYGWGCVPVTATIGAVEFRTSLFPRDGGYLLPLKAVVRRALGIVPGETVAVTLAVVLPICASSA